MALWDDLLDEIYKITNRPDMVIETAVALRQAVRMAHKSGRYWRDLATVTIAADSSLQVQEIDLTISTTRFRTVAKLASAAVATREFRAVNIDDVVDEDGYLRPNVYWGLGTKLQLRAACPEDSYVLTYYQYPLVTPTAAFSSWIAGEHRDLLVLWASSQVLGTVGEQEIRSRLEPMAALELSELQKNSLEIVGR